MASEAFKKLNKKIPQYIKDKVEKEIDYLDEQTKELEKLLSIVWNEHSITNRNFMKKISKSLISRGVRIIDDE